MDAPWLCVGCSLLSVGYSLDFYCVVGLFCFEALRASMPEFKMKMGLGFANFRRNLNKLAELANKNKKALASSCFFFKLRWT